MFHFYSAGGRGQIKQKKKTVPQKITIAKIPRAKKKYVTRVCGLATFGKVTAVSIPYLYFLLVLMRFCGLSDIDLKEAQRFFAQKFSCGASVTADDEIIIQGDFTDDIIDVIQEKWPEVNKHLNHKSTSHCPTNIHLLVLRHMAGLNLCVIIIRTPLDSTGG